MAQGDPNERTEIIGSGKLAPDGPFKIEMKVHFVGIAGEYEGQDAWADIDLPPGRVPSDEDIRKRIQAAIEYVGPNFRLADRHTFVRELLTERAGIDMNFAVPGPNAFRLDEGASA